MRQARALGLVLAATAFLSGCGKPAETVPAPIPVSANPVVETSAGPVQGIQKDGVSVFLGVPFAAPPVGDLRWRPPQPPKPWTETRLATSFAPACTQNPAGPGGRPPVSEDCLHLNVWTQVADPKAKRPVMVWIFGGGFNIGATSWPQFDGTSLSKRGVVLVSVSYRLGKFGFFAHPELTRESPNAPLGNYAVLDIVEGLKWVKANATAFGGDPDNVTIFGESAGGAMVNMLMVAPQARGLFHRAIVESGGPFPMGTFAEAETAGEAASKTWGARGADIAALRAVPAKTILGGATMSEGGSQPMIDGRIVPQDILAAFRAGQMAKVPYLLGTNGYEAGLFPDSAKGLADKYKAQWPKLTAVLDGYGTKKTELVEGELATYRQMTAPARSAARAASAAGVPTYLYAFNYLRPSQRGKLPAPLHFDEIFPLFGVMPLAPGKDENDPKIVDAIQSRFVAFAKTGKPGDDWPAFKVDDEQTLEFGNDGVAVRKDYLKAQLDLVDGLAE